MRQTHPSGHCILRDPVAGFSRHRLLKLLCTLLSCLLFASQIYAQSSQQAAAPLVRILAIDPPSGAIMYKGDALHARIAYRSEVPLHFQMEGYFDGAPNRGAHSSPVPLQPVGEGETIAWLAYQGAAYLDEVRLKVMDERWQIIDTVTMRVSVGWQSEAGTRPQSHADWVVRLNDEQQASIRNTVRSQTDEAGYGFGLLFMLVGWSVPGYFALQIYMLKKYRDRWRKASLVPLLVMVPLLLHALFALSAGSNLWPLLLIFASPFAFVYLVGVVIVRRFKT